MKRVIILSVFVLLVLTSVSSYCFCAGEAGSNVVSFQRSHDCCDSKQMSHCVAHIDKACQAERQNEFTIPSFNLQSDPEAVLTSSFISNLNSHQVETLPFTAFQKTQESLFLKNEVLRI